MAKLSFVIPSYNEKDSLQELVSRIQAVIVSKQYDAEILIIDDGSRDESFLLLQELRKQFQILRIIKFRRNAGKALALKAGFTHATGDIIIMMDADLQDSPEDIPLLLAKLDEGYDVVTGWKQKRHDPLHKTLPSHILNWIVKKIFSLNLHDFNCGFKAFKKEVVSDLPLYGALYRYILFFAHANGYRIAEIPTHHSPRKHGQSKYSISHRFRGIFDLLTVVFLIRYLRRPMHFFGGTGAFIGFIGLCSLIYLAILRFMGYSIGQRPLLLFGVLCVLVGIQLFIFGLLAELIISQSKESPPPIEKIL